MTPEPVPDAAERARARTLFLQRFAELVHPDSDIGRRARTLNVRTAVEEAAALAASFVRSGGRTRNVAEPHSAGHGIAMLPDVAREALDLLSDDVVLKRGHPEIVDPLRIALEKLTQEEPDCDSSRVAEVQAYAAQLARTYCGDALQLIRTIIADRPRELLQLESAAQGLVSDLRARGWTDQALLEKVVGLGSANEFDTAFDAFSRELTAAPRRFTCYVAVTIQEVEDQLPEEPEFHIVDVVPGPPAGFPTQGPYILTAVDAVDPRVAADVAVARVAAVIGAVAIFVRQDVLVRSRFVAVAAPGSAPVSMDSSSPLPREPRIPRAGQVGRTGCRTAVQPLVTLRDKRVQKLGPEVRAPPPRVQVSKPSRGRSTCRPVMPRRGTVRDAAQTGDPCCACSAELAGGALGSRWAAWRRADAHGGPRRCGMAGDLKETIRMALVDMFDRGHPETLENIGWLSFIGHDPVRGTLSLGETRDLAKGFRAGFPDLHCSVLDAISEGDRVACRWRMTGTHRGAFLGFEPTGRRVVLDGIGFFRFHEDRWRRSGWSTTPSDCCGNSASSPPWTSCGSSTRRRRRAARTTRATSTHRAETPPACALPVAYSEFSHAS